MSDPEVAFSGEIGRRALQRRLTALVDAARLNRHGSRRWTRYVIPAVPDYSIPESGGEQTLSTRACAVLRRLQIPMSERPVVNYRSDYLREYIPGETTWLSEPERIYLRRLGTVIDKVQPAGTYA